MKSNTKPQKIIVYAPLKKSERKKISPLNWLYILAITTFVISLLLSNFKITPPKLFSVISIFGLIIFIGEIIFHLEAGTKSHSPKQRRKKQIEIFSNNAGLTAEGKTVTWHVWQEAEKEFYRLSPNGSISGTSENIATTVGEKLTQYLNLNSKIPFILVDTITTRSDITFIYTHQELEREEYQFDL